MPLERQKSGSAKMMQRTASSALSGESFSSATSSRTALLSQLGRRTSTSTSQPQRSGVSCEASKARFFVGGNWKSNGSVGMVSGLVQDLNAAAAQVPPGIDVVVAPPYVYLDYVVSHLDKDKFQVSAQNVSLYENGAYTGEVSAEMIKDFGIPWVIVGHSERRSLMREDNKTVGDKAKRSLEQGLGVIACIGETLEQRQGGQMFNILDAQMAAIVDAIGARNAEHWGRTVIAYEPVWAIGTGQVATPEQAQEVHAHLRKWLEGRLGVDLASTLRIIYGGSANDKNCKDLAGQEDIDGFLVGGASLKAGSFITIAQSASAKKVTA